ncbi:MAG: C39 family peptidase [Verrucomicrobiales bacterium]|nr:C39 family peptidase [Verrucomicrobiales bacterium]
MDARGIQFIPFHSLARFERLAATEADRTVLLSPEIRARVRWDEMIVSWNAEAPPGTFLRVEARALYPDRATKFYCLGVWSADAKRHPRESVPGQKDADGDVDTDTLMLREPAERFQLRLTLGGESAARPRIKFLGVCLTDTGARPAPLPPVRAARGKTLPVPERSQMLYENGDVLCSPTTLSMLLAWWSERLGRPELNRDVPEVAAGVFDPKWGGTGNWVFNTAYAGAFEGLRAYTARLSDVAELEAWIARGIPVGLSLCYNRLRGRGNEPSGHLVVCVGFTQNGDVVVNDPGTRRNVRKTFPRANLIHAWAYKHNTVYLVYPPGARLPTDRFGHWDSPLSRRRASG